MMENILQTIGNTPIVRINKLNPNKNVNIYAKLEGFNPTGSIKDRIALEMIQQAERQGQLVPGKTIIEPTSGNTGIALAMIGTILGYRVEIVMSEAVSVERRQMIKALGGESSSPTPYQGPMGPSERPGNWYKSFRTDISCRTSSPTITIRSCHYRTTGEEIWRQTFGKIDYFVSALGTSGTLMGVGRALKEHNPNIKLVSAHPVKGHYIQGLKNMEEAIVPSIYDPSILDITIMVETEAAYDMARQIARKEGIFVGMSSGAAMYAAAETAKKIDSGNIVVIFPDRGEKYLSTKLFQV